ncbi:hypothetical protein AV530_000359 [Patagioenas fasciata monilis]|uniref:TRDC protein n=1 Tax=Patagioenas fasciata monilis TaxID=372326 RepID=A0A1V4KA25_PATFA|nr:hypothetical protein AV530_000359 [Patagioenas fasciata monilis]
METPFALPPRASQAGSNPLFWPSFSFGNNGDFGALRQQSIVATDKLVFGTGITFSVEPKSQEESAPEVIVLKSKEAKQYDKLNVACLARTFYPKNISLDVPKSDIVYDLKAPLVTSEGMYSTMKIVGVEPGAEVTCKVMHTGNKNTDSIIVPEEKTEEFETVNACSITGASTKDAKMEKANMLFMAVLGNIIQSLETQEVLGEPAMG